jgi:hypothetical protein
MGPGRVDAALLLGQCGLAGLATILVALIVIWNGYVRKVRWAWFVMLIIVCGWYFPLFIYQTLSYARGPDVFTWLSSSRWAWIFLVMLTALILPAGFFFRKPHEEADGTQVD